MLEESIENKEIKSYKINTVNLLSTRDFSKLLFKHYHKKIREGTIFTTLKTKKATKKN